ncbi:SUKH-3 domain-containing protein [Streptomyces sparsogenes]|uniref:SUKH-3 domain-containing protein n=1 Tax=Streptomyces sparsogenes TaxID=67365 RepID=UPI0033E6231B
MKRVELEPEAVRRLKNSGWEPGRNVQHLVDAWVEQLKSMPDGPQFSEPPEAVIEMLREFGGLHVRVAGPGRTMMRYPFTLDPRKGLLSPAAYAQLSQQAGSATYPLGVLYGEESAIAGDAQGRVLLITSIGPMIEGIDIHDALNHMILGVRPENL